MNIHEALSHLFEAEGNKVAIVEDERVRDATVFSAPLPGCPELFLWVKYDDTPHPVPFTMCASMMVANYIQVS